MTKRSWLILLFILLLIPTEAFSYGASIRVKAVSPIYKTEIQDVSMYEATIPIVFHVQLPTVMTELSPYFDELCKTNTTISGDMNGTERVKDEFYCALEEQFLLASSHIIKDLQQQTTYHFEEGSVKGHLHFNGSTTSIGRSRRQAAPIIVGASLLAGFLLRPAVGKFTGSLFGTNDDDDWSKHYNDIRKSLLEEHKILLEFQQSTHTFAQEMTSILGNISEVLIAQKRDLIGSLRLLTTKMHADFIKEAVHSCKANLLPENLIKQDFLKPILANLDRNVSNALNYSLAIDYNDKRGLAKYFELPIADCMFAEDKVLIMLNLPLKKTNSLWKLFEVIHTKFSYNGQVCEVYPQEANYLAEETNTNKSVLISRNMLKYCSILDQRLCMIPRFERESTQSLRCTGTGHQSSLEEFSKTCSFQCYTSDELIITEVDEKTIIVTNAETLTYNCSGSQVKTIKTGKLGALEINLDCGCSIVINGNEKLPKPFPCPISNNATAKFTGPSISFTVPILWTHNASSLNTGIVEEMDNHTEIAHHINRHWSWVIPVLNFTTTRGLSNASFAVPEEVLVSSHTSTMSFVGVWLTLVTGILLLHVIFTFYCFFKLALSRGGYGAVPPPSFNHIVENECPKELEDDTCVKRRQHKHKSPSVKFQEHNDENLQRLRRGEESDQESGSNSDVYRSNRNSIINKLI